MGMGIVEVLGQKIRTYRKSRHPQQRADPPYPHWLPFLS